ncbi:DUF3325 domain-containing protein [Sphingobium sp. YR768]|uniref:DUF3325 domain-containing protein n=1 Tax=Sphingobium sp. YR768 TaxID=1884365 RepID=UPI000B85F62A|nr:DUF3325 domain-containing protein [Sphingobium sp. YR768]
MILLAFFLAHAGFMAFGLSMARHRRDLHLKPIGARRATGLRICGYGLLGIAIWPCWILFALSVGIIVWIGILSAAAISLTVLLAWPPFLAMWSKAFRLTASMAERLREAVR